MAIGDGTFSDGECLEHSGGRRGLNGVFVAAALGPDVADGFYVLIH